MLASIATVTFSTTSIEEPLLTTNAPPDKIVSDLAEAFVPERITGGTVEVPITTQLSAVGTPVGVQFSALFQSLPRVPFQVFPLKITVTSVRDDSQVPSAAAT